MHKILPALAWGCRLIVFGMAFGSCENSQEKLDQFNRKQLAVEEAVQVESYLSQSGNTKARLSAPLMIRYTTDSIRVEFPKGLHTEFFLDKDQLSAYNLPPDTNIVESHIFSRYGKYTELNNVVYLKDSVLAYNLLKRDTLWCDELWWDQEKKIIYTKSRFRFKTHDGQDMRGEGKETGFEAKQDLSEYTLYRSKGTMLAPPGTIPY
jgi:hypothetical protein